MKITITHARYAPSWTSLQEVVRESLNDQSGRFTRIRRLDGGCDYRGLGEYEIDFKSGDTIRPIRLEVTGF